MKFKKIKNKLSIIKYFQSLFKIIIMKKYKRLLTNIN